MIVELLFGTIWAVQVGMTVWSLGQTRQFLVVTPRIADEVALQRYKDFVRVQMYLALVSMCLILPAALLGVLVVLRHGLPGLALVLIGSSVLLGVSLYLRSWEVRARALEATSEGLMQAYRRVSETWVKKPLPDF